MAGECGLRCRSREGPQGRPTGQHAGTSEGPFIGPAVPWLNLTLISTTIRTDSAGRFCLNDLHKAAGKRTQDQPGFFLRRKETSQLIDALSADSQNAPLVAKKGNEAQGGGTYVVKELVYAYAMWVSPKFHIQVIRAPIGATTSSPSLSPTKAMR